MKKKIALFLLAALVSAGLIVSCGGDDPEDTKKPGTDPSKPTVQYTVTFNTDGGTPETIEPIKVNAGSAAGAAKWPNDPARGALEVFDGWYEGTTVYTSNTKIEKDVALTAKYSPFVWPAATEEYVIPLGAITWKNGPSQQGWRSDGTDNTETDLEWETIQYAKYLVLHTKGGADATEATDAAENDTPDTWKTQFNGLQVVAQGDGNSYAWSQTNLDKVEFVRAADKDVYIVIDTRTLIRFKDIVGGTKGKLLIAYWNIKDSMFLGLGLQEAYLTNKDLTKPADAVDITSNGTGGKSGYVTANNVLGLTAPSSTFTVTFNTDSGIPAVAPIVVGSGKYLGVRYPDWVKKEGYDFDGWFNGATEITASTPITANVTVTAKWKVAYNFDDIANAEKIGGTYESSTNAEWSINGKFPFKYFIVATTALSNSGGLGGIQFGVQGAGVDQKIKVTGDFTGGISSSGDDIVYLIIDVSTFSNFDAASSASWAQFRINYGATALGSKYQGYVTAKTTLTKPDGAVDFSGITSYPPDDGGDDPIGLTGYVTKVLPVELQ